MRHLRACVPDHERHGCCGAELPPADRCNPRGKVPLLTLSITGWLETVRHWGSGPLRQPEAHIRAATGHAHAHGHCPICNALACIQAAPGLTSRVRHTQPLGPEMGPSGPLSHLIPSRHPVEQDERPASEHFIWQIGHAPHQQQHARSSTGARKVNGQTSAGDLIMANIGCTMSAGCCRPTTVDADRCKAVLESGLLRFPPVTGPDRSHSLLLQTGVLSSPGASAILTRQNTPAPRPLLVPP
jgi:hypothetical protein